MENQDENQQQGYGSATDATDGDKPYQGAPSRGMGGSDIRGEDSAPGNPNKTSLPTDGPVSQQEVKDEDDLDHVET